MVSNESGLSISKEAQAAYLHELSKSLNKMLCIIEGETGWSGGTPRYPGQQKVSAERYIFSVLLKMNAMNELMNYDLTQAMVDVKAVHDNYSKLPHDEIKSIIFEAKHIVDQELGQLNSGRSPK